MNNPQFRIIATLSFLVVAYSQSANGQLSSDAKTKRDELLALRLIDADLEDANRTIAVLDVDDDGRLDEKERSRLTWSAEAKDYDLNNDDVLTQIEVAMRNADYRNQNDVLEIDGVVAKRTMMKRDTNRNGQIDPNEISAAWPEDPDEIDTNGDGILTQNELTIAFAFRRNIREAIGVMGVDQGWAIKVRNRFDEDKDGKLSSEEWKDAPLPSDPAKFDEDGDGLVSLTELATLLAKHRIRLGLAASDQLRSREMIRRFDDNFDGILPKKQLDELNETSEPLVTMFRQYDANKDGAVTLYEIEKVMGEQRDAMGYSADDASAARILIARHDRNANSMIEKNELNKSAEKGYLSSVDLPQIDRDGNTQITLDELARHLARQKD